MLIARSHFLGERRLSLVACAALLPFDHDHHERHEEHEHGDRDFSDGVFKMTLMTKATE